MASEGVPGFEPYNMMWAALNFFVLLAILYKFAYDPLLKMLDDRRNTIESSLRHAEEVRVDIERMKQEAQGNLLEARREAQEIVARATKIGEETREDILTKAKEEAANERKKAVQEIESAKDRALNELRNTAATLAIMAAEKVLGKTITSDDHQKMVREFVDEVGDRLC
ncbi:MAG: F0F1 ATP synthase subunit B [Firmicutes bacterium]|nr:F0F1 ATP synthase subunit B [Bacillota bacterium]